MKEDDIVDLKAAIEEAETTGDYSTLNRMVRNTATPEPSENSIRERNVDLTELQNAEQALIAIKDGDDFEAKAEAAQIVAILRAAHREGEIEANRRSHGLGVDTGGF